jgi:hypothetical protein
MGHILDYKPRRFNNALEDSLDGSPSTMVDQSTVNPATGKAWTWLEKLMGVASQGVDVVNKYKSGTVTTGGGPVSASVGRIDPEAQPTFLGMPRMVGIGVTVAVVGLVGFALWKINKK